METEIENHTNSDSGETVSRDVSISKWHILPFAVKDQWYKDIM